MLFVPERRAGPELLDLPAAAQNYPELAESLADIRKVNRYLGGTKAAVEHFSAMLDGLGTPAGKPITVLDVATGSADVPIALVDWARGRGFDIKVHAVDINPAVIKHASERTLGYPEITLGVADALDLPFGDVSFDFVMCALTLHHLPEAETRAFLKRLSAIARLGFIVGDLRRSWIAYGLIYILTRLLTANRLTRYDGPLSVLRSYTIDELAALADAAGLTGFKVIKDPFWRMALVGGPAWAKV